MSLPTRPWALLKLDLESFSFCLTCSNLEPYCLCCTYGIAGWSRNPQHLNCVFPRGIQDWPLMLTYHAQTSP
jgi:hypothetical protein